jgi:hypothetical protein
MLRRADAVELESLALYYASQSPKARSAPAVGDPAAGESLALRCTGCHGWRGVSERGDATLAGQDPVPVKALSGSDLATTSMSDSLLLGKESDILATAARSASRRARHAPSRNCRTNGRCRGPRWPAYYGDSAFARTAPHSVVTPKRLSELTPRKPTMNKMSLLSARQFRGIRRFSVSRAVTNIARRLLAVARSARGAHLVDPRTGGESTDLTTWS